ncbi:MAG: hypothetical protein ACJA1E_000835 [Paracoccaceae bacterium]|jgi:hypothetical protein
MKIRSILLTSTLVAATAGSLAFGQTDQAQQPLPKEGAQVLIVGADSADTHRNEHNGNRTEDADDANDDHDSDHEEQDSEDHDSSDDGKDHDGKDHDSEGHGSNDDRDSSDSDDRDSGDDSDDGSDND